MAGHLNGRLLQSMSAKQGVPMGTLEKDYALTRLLYVMAKFPKLDSVVFKGGTALRKIYFEDGRFSADLDFTCLDDVSAEFCEFVGANMAGSDVRFTEIGGEERRQESFKFKARYVQCNGTAESIRVDMSLRTDVLGSAAPGPVLNPYDDSPPASIPTMSLEEIMAEKVRAVLYSKHSRHLFDLHFLHDRGVRINPEWVRSKIKAAYGDEFSMDRFQERVYARKSPWARDLQRFLPGALPPFETVSGKVVDLVREAMGSGQVRH